MSACRKSERGLKGRGSKGGGSGGAAKERGGEEREGVRNRTGRGASETVTIAFEGALERVGEKEREGEGEQQPRTRKRAASGIL